MQSRCSFVAFGLDELDCQSHNAVMLLAVPGLAQGKRGHGLDGLGILWVCDCFNKAMLWTLTLMANVLCPG